MRLSLPGPLQALLAVDRTDPVRPSAMAIGALGMAVPVAFGLLLGQPHAGFLIGLGAVLLAGGPAEASSTGGGRTTRLLATALPALAAVATATLLARLPAPDPAMILTVAIAALSVNYSRPLAGAAIRFNIYCVLGMTLIEGSAGHGAGGALVFGLGALWNILLRLLLDLRGSTESASADARRQPSPAQRRAYLRKQLRSLAGWQFPLRLAIGLGIASLLRHAFPAHHFAWIVLTVALLTEHAIAHLPVTTVQRLLVTIGGVALAWLLFTVAHGPIALGIVAAVLAMLVPVARARSSLLYATLSAPLILLVIDIGQPVAPGLLVDRLVATLIGGAIVVALNLAFDRLRVLTPPALPSAGR
ncbi:Fusaric acid resistance protein-like [Sphingomonas sp. NFR04]|nr:Fusaric acid resistance protein-like [Sphingomonas sp. NFR04]